MPLGGSNTKTCEALSNVVGTLGFISIVKKRRKFALS